MYLVFKRAFDILFALVILCITSPIVIIAMILIKIESKGPIFFLQERLGYKKQIYNENK